VPLPRCSTPAAEPTTRHDRWRWRRLAVVLLGLCVGLAGLAGAETARTPAGSKAASKKPAAEKAGKKTSSRQRKKSAARPAAGDLARLQAESVPPSSASS